MNAARQFNYLSHEEKCAIRVLLYFDIFNYPLTEIEVEKYLPQKNTVITSEVLYELINKKIIFNFNGFYSPQNYPGLGERRIKGNQLAEKKLLTAKRYTAIISRLPFVRAVMLSGSISKGYMDEKSDIDYFIITEQNRLWIVRTALAIFRRLFLFNSRKNLCTNYFVDVQNLEIGEKNIFTAMECCTLIPMYGHSVISKFNQSNSWVHVYLPNAKPEIKESKEKNFPIKYFLEKILPDAVYKKINRWLLHKSLAYWKRRYSTEVSPVDFEIAFRSTNGVSKSHPQFFQKKVLDRLTKKIESFEAQHNTNLSL